MAPSTGGNREIPACVFCECSHFVQDRLLSLLKQDYFAQKKRLKFSRLLSKLLRCVGDSTAEQSEGEAGIPLKIKYLFIPATPNYVSSAHATDSK